MSGRPEREVVPLLPSAHSHPSPTHRRGVYFSEDNADQEETLLLASNKRRSPSLLITDACLLVIHFLQMFAVLLSLALRWPWPVDFLQATKIIFLVNLDVWEFLKLTSAGTYNSIQNYYTPSDLMVVQYRWILLAWAVFLFVAFLVFFLTYMVLTYKKPPQMLVHVARLKRVYIVAAQVLCLPLGITIARLFHCNESYMMDVSSSIPCFQKTHWLYLTPAIAVAVIVYILFPLWLILRTKTEMLNLTPDRHEGYVQLKEMEYTYGLDMLWLVGNFHVFSSFRKNGAHFRAGLYCFNTLVLLIYGALFKSTIIQAMFIDIVLTLAMIAFVVQRPFRLAVYNGMLIVSLLCLSLDGLLGALQIKFTASSVQMVWLLPHYQIILLCIINGAWIFLCLVFVLYLSLHGQWCRNRCRTKSLWPTQHALQHLDPRTHKYIMAVLRSRLLIERVMTMPPMFAPAHQLDRQIHVINAYCREAEYMRDPLHHILWDLLDSLIDIHSQVSPKSLFAVSVKESIRSTASEFMKLMPGFVRRLAQREYDLLLVRPVKRRLLLKLYCLALFLRHTRKRKEQQQLTFPAIENVWQHHDTEDRDDGYYEDMYPQEEVEPEGLPQHPTITIDLLNEYDIDDAAVIAEAEEWLKLQQPLTPHTIQADVESSPPDLEDDPLPGYATHPESRSVTPTPQAGHLDVSDSLMGSAGARSRPSLGAGSRPASGAGSRPPSVIGSQPSSGGASSDSGRLTPLPGQTLDDEDLLGQSTA